MPYTALIETLGRQAREASLALATAPTARKNAALTRLAALLGERSADVLAANTRDLAAARAAGLAAPLLERLTLTPARLVALAESVRQVADLPDPVGEELERIRRPNGLDIRKIRVPLGVIAIIYESRPNVTIDCAILCLKSGNACILRGGKEAFETNTALAALLTEALGETGLPVHAVQFVPTPDRAALFPLLKLEKYIHCVIPRGGEALIKMVAEHATVPVIKHFKGVCTVYVDKDADPALAEKILVNAKVQRPSVCNAAENLFIHAAATPALLPRLARALAAHHVELRADPAARALLQNEPGLKLTPATESDFSEEYLDLIIAVKVVPNLDAAIAAINHYGSGHSDTIVTRDETAAHRFLAGVDSATVYWNASTRFTDGFEFGLGAEIGISTDRLHARGPMGLRELCSYKYIILGNGQIRE
ncbi:MAG: glutamate-5-semialdehyde dehydrogenase [Opitutales bacterium]|jgi:glutamate-5-semialdehyde dehydrogenase